MMRRDAKIYIAGHTGLVGSALFRYLLSRGYNKLLYRNHRNLDLTDQSAVNEFFEDFQPEYVFMCAGKVGGILANSTGQAQYLYDNLMMGTNVIEASRRHHVKKLLYLGSSCIYPKDTTVPIKESQLMTGKPEPTNEGYAIAKIACIELAKFYRKQYGLDFISVIPCNLYGLRDRFDPLYGHFIPAMIAKVHKALKDGSRLTVMGTGEPLREFMYADDLAEVMVLLMNNYSEKEPINVGTGKSISIEQATKIICELSGYSGELVYDTTKPDGQFEKTMDITKMSNYGWAPKTSFEEGIKKTIEWYKEHA